MIRWECTFCGNELSAENQDAGDKIECDFCKALQFVPESSGRRPRGERETWHDLSWWEKPGPKALTCIFSALACITVGLSLVAVGAKEAVKAMPDHGAITFCYVSAGVMFLLSFVAGIRALIAALK